MTPTDTGYQLDAITTVSFFIVWLFITMLAMALAHVAWRHIAAAWSATLLTIIEIRRRT